MLKSEGFNERELPSVLIKRLSHSRINSFEIFLGLPDDLGKVFVEISSSPKNSKTPASNDTK